jgi:hypothetical protein
MYFFAVLGLLLFGVFLIFVGRQSASVQRGRKYRRRILQDNGSDLSILSIAPNYDIPVHEVGYHDAPVGNYASDNVVDGNDGTSYDSGGGDLGSALADTINEDGNSFGGFDSGSDFGGGDSSGGGTND